VREGGRIPLTNSDEVWQEARKAEGATYVQVTQLDWECVWDFR